MDLTTKDATLSTSANGINYYVTHSSDESSFRPFGILAAMAEDNTDSMIAEGLFFTEAEALAYCKWLAENEVYPISLCEVLANIYVL